MKLILKRYLIIIIACVSTLPLLVPKCVCSLVHKSALCTQALVTSADVENFFHNYKSHSHWLIQVMLTQWPLLYSLFIFCKGTKLVDRWLQYKISLFVTTNEWSMFHFCVVLFCLKCNDLAMFYASYMWGWLRVIQGFSAWGQLGNDVPYLSRRT